MGMMSTLAAPPSSRAPAALIAVAPEAHESSMSKTRLLATEVGPGLNAVGA